MTEGHTEYDVSEELARWVSCGMIRGMAQMSYLVLTLPARETSSRSARHTNRLSDVVGLRLSQWIKVLLGVTRVLPTVFFSDPVGMKERYCLTKEKALK